MVSWITYIRKSRLAKISLLGHAAWVAQSLCWFSDGNAKVPSLNNTSLLQISSKFTMSSTSKKLVLVLGANRGPGILQFVFATILIFLLGKPNCQVPLEALCGYFHRARSHERQQESGCPRTGFSRRRSGWSRFWQRDVTRRRTGWRPYHILYHKFLGQNSYDIEVEQGKLVNKLASQARSSGISWSGCKDNGAPDIFLLSELAEIPGSIWTYQGAKLPLWITFLKMEIGTLSSWIKKTLWFCYKVAEYSTII